MPILPIECPFCGGSLTVDSEMEAAVCRHCRKPYSVKDAVYQSYYRLVSHGAAAPANARSNSDFIIRGGTLVRYEGELQDVIIPDGVKTIGKEAGCTDKLNCIKDGKERTNGKRNLCYEGCFTFNRRIHC